MARPCDNRPGESRFPAHRSVGLTIFWHCGHAPFSSRTAPRRTSGNEPSTVLAEDFRASKGLAMLIRSEKYGVRGGAAKAASMTAPAIPAATAPTLLGGLLLLIGP